MKAMLKFIFTFKIVDDFFLIVEKIKTPPRFMGMKVKFMRIEKNVVNVMSFAFDWREKYLFARKMNIGKGGG